MALLSARTNGSVKRPIPSSLLDDILSFSPSHNFNTGIEIINSDGGFVIEIPVPGFKRGEIDVTLDSNILSIAAKNERRSISRSLIIPEEIDTENIDITAEHGMLTIHLRSHPKAQPKKIDVRYNE